MKFWSFNKCILKLHLEIENYAQNYAAKYRFLLTASLWQPQGYWFSEKLVRF